MKPLVAKTTLVALKDLKCKRLEDDYREHPDDLIYQALEKELQKDGRYQRQKILTQRVLIRELVQE